jgi:hypothetical protein
MHEAKKLKEAQTREALQKEGFVFALYLFPRYMLVSLDICLSGDI